MHGRSGPICLAVGLMIGGAATVAMAGGAHGLRDADGYPGAATELWLAVWAGCAVLGLLVGLIALRRGGRADTHRGASATPPVSAAPYRVPAGDPSAGSTDRPRATAATAATAQESA